MATMLRTHTGTSLTGTCPDHGVRTFSRPWRSLSPADAADAQTLTKYADTAMYQAKRTGRDTFQFFTSAMNTEVLRRRALETALRQAVRNEEFVLYYQPKEQLSSGQVVGIEALLRWERPGHGLVQPSEFICALEDCGLIVDVGRWVITAACKQIRDWLRRGMDPVQVSVNVSERQYVKGDLQGDVLNALDAYGVPAELLKLELTESLLMNNTDRTITLLQNLKAAGVQISINDFGTGFSSLAYLRRFPSDKLKIDRSFIRDVTHNPDDAAITLATIQMGHSLDLVAIAQGVETAAQLAYLQHHQCDQMQGCYFSRPLPVPDLERLLLAQTSPWHMAVRPYTATTLLLLANHTCVLVTRSLKSSRKTWTRSVARTPRLVPRLAEVAEQGAVHSADNRHAVRADDRDEYQMRLPRT